MFIIFWRNIEYLMTCSLNFMHFENYITSFFFEFDKCKSRMNFTTMVPFVI